MSSPGHRDGWAVDRGSRWIGASQADVQEGGIAAPGGDTAGQE